MKYYPALPVISHPVNIVSRFTAGVWFFRAALWSFEAKDIGDRYERLDDEYPEVTDLHHCQNQEANKLIIIFLRGAPFAVLEPTIFQLVLSKHSYYCPLYPASSKVTAALPSKKGRVPPKSPPQKGLQFCPSTSLVISRFVILTL